MSASFLYCILLFKTYRFIKSASSVIGVQNKFTLSLHPVLWMQVKTDKATDNVIPPYLLDPLSLADYTELLLLR